MEGSGSGKSKLSITLIQKSVFERAGLPVKSAAAWQKSGFRVTGNFKRDAAAGTKYWRVGADLLAKLPNKPKRTAEQKIAAELILLDCRRAREDFLQTARRDCLSQAHQKSRQFCARGRSCL